MSSGSGQSSNTTQVQQIPAFEQQASLQNQALAQSLGSQPFPTYQGALIQPQNALQSQGQSQAVNAANAYQQPLSEGQNAVGTGLGYLPGAISTGVNTLSNVQQLSGNTGDALQAGLGLSAANPGDVNAYMSPYVEASLQPQLLQAQTQLGQQQQATNAQATQANAFGDARQGVENSWNNYLGDQTMAGIQAQGYNTAYGNALNAINAQQGQYTNAANAYTGLGSELASAGGTVGNIVNTAANTALSGGTDLGNLAGLAQSLGISGANAIYTAGQQQQQLGQQDLNAAYQQYLNQVNWPYQMLNVQESALSNSPYNIATALQLPNTNATAQGFGGLSSIAGLLGGLGSGSGTSANVFGGA